MGLLEVEAEDLLVLQDAIACRRLEPRGELLMELCAQLLRHRVIRRISDQLMPEAEGVLARKLSMVGPDELLANEGLEVTPHFGPDLL